MNELIHAITYPHIKNEVQRILKEAQPFKRFLFVIQNESVYEACKNSLEKDFSTRLQCIPSKSDRKEGSFLKNWKMQLLISSSTEPEALLYEPVFC